MVPELWEELKKRVQDIFVPETPHAVEYNAHGVMDQFGRWTYADPKNTTLPIPLPQHVGEYLDRQGRVTTPSQAEMPHYTDVRREESIQDAVTRDRKLEVLGPLAVVAPGAAAAIAGGVARRSKRRGGKGNANNKQTGGAGKKFGEGAAGALGRELVVRGIPLALGYTGIRGAISDISSELDSLNSVLEGISSNNEALRAAIDRIAASNESDEVKLDEIARLLALMYEEDSSFTAHIELAPDHDPLKTQRRQSPNANPTTSGGSLVRQSDRAGFDPKGQIDGVDIPGGTGDQLPELGDAIRKRVPLPGNN